MNQDRAWIEIDAQKLEHNLRKIENAANGSKVMAVVKDQFYGMGMDTIVHLQNLGVDHFAVATIDEALQLRFGGISKPILILGSTEQARFLELHQYDLTQSIVTHDLGKNLLDFAEKHQIQIKTHIKINTGMNRLGLKADNNSDYQKIKGYYQNEFLKVLGTFTHLLAADQYDDEGDRVCRLQLERFNQFLEHLQSEQINPGITHVYNSAGIERYSQEFVYDYCRPGLFFSGTKTVSGYEICFSLKAKIAMVKEVKAKSQVGYGYENKINKTSKIATVSIGYGDGLRRNLFKTNYRPRVHNQACPLVGRICMDLLMIDVSQVKSVKVGDVVDLIDENFSLEEVAELLDTIPNEIMTQFNKRLPRILVQQEDK